MDYSPPGFSVHGISQARMQEWAAISFSKGIFSTQRSSPRLLPLLLWQADCLPQRHLGSPRTLHWHSLYITEHTRKVSKDDVKDRCRAPSYFHPLPQGGPLFWAVWAPLWRTLLPLPWTMCFASPLWPPYLESKDVVSVALGNTNFFEIRMQRGYLSQGKGEFREQCKALLV